MNMMALQKRLYFQPMEVIYPFSAVQSLSHVWIFVTPWTAEHPLVYTKL